MWWSLIEMTVLSEQRQPCDCPAEERKVSTLCPNVPMAEGRAIVEVLQQHQFTRQCVMSFRFLNFNSSFLNCRKSWASFASDSSNIRAKLKRIQEASSLRRTLNSIKTTTAIQLVNSPAFHEGTNKKNHSGWVMGGGVIRPRRCTGVWVYKAAPLCWAGRTPPAESGRWIWWRPHQGWRRLGHLLHTAGTSREKKTRSSTIFPTWLIQ